MEETNTNPISPAAEPIQTPVEVPSVAPVVTPISEPITPVESTTVPVASTPPAPTAPAPVAPPVEAKPEVQTPAQEPESALRRLLIKAKEKIQFRKQAKLEKIMAKAREQGSITNDQAQKLLRVSDATASRYLGQLVKSGRLRLVKAKGRGARYAPAQ